MQTSIVRTTLRNDLGMRIVEVDNEAATLEGTDVLFTGKKTVLMCERTFRHVIHRLPLISHFTSLLAKQRYQ